MGCRSIERHHRVGNTNSNCTSITFGKAAPADDILYELLLKSGFPLTTPVETKTLAGKTVHFVAGGALVICLERSLTLDLIRAIADAQARAGRVS